MFELTRKINGFNRINIGYCMSNHFDVVDREIDIHQAPPAIGTKLYVQAQHLLTEKGSNN